MVGRIILPNILLLFLFLRKELIKEFFVYFAIGFAALHIVEKLNFVIKFEVRVKAPELLFVSI